MDAPAIPLNPIPFLWIPPCIPPPIHSPSPLSQGCFIEHLSCTMLPIHLAPSEWTEGYWAEAQHSSVGMRHTTGRQRRGVAKGGNPGIVPWGAAEARAASGGASGGGEHPMLAAPRPPGQGAATTCTSRTMTSRGHMGMTHNVGAEVAHAARTTTSHGCMGRPGQRANASMGIGKEHSHCGG